MTPSRQMKRVKTPADDAIEGRPASRKPTLRNAKRERIHDRIIESATRMFAEQGMDGPSLRDIAKDCGIPQSSMAYYFPKKTLLQEAVITSAIVRLSDRYKKAAGKSSHIDTQIEDYVTASIEGLTGNLPETIILVRELYSKNRSDIQESIIQGLRNDQANEVYTSLMLRTDSPLLKFVSPGRLNDLVFGAIFGIIKLSGLQHLGEPSKQVTIAELGQELNLIVKMLLRPGTLEAGDAGGSATVAGDGAATRPVAASLSPSRFPSDRSD